MEVGSLDPEGVTVAIYDDTPRPPTSNDAPSDTWRPSEDVMFSCRRACRHPRNEGMGDARIGRQIAQPTNGMRRAPPAEDYGQRVDRGVNDE